METPLVSIHLIVKDGEKYIKDCLEHVKKQAYPNIEFRLFDNASMDKTVGMAQEVMPGVEVIHFEKNHGLGGGFNRSLKWSNAPYVVGLCVDVMMAPDFVEKAVEVAEKNARIGVVQAKIMRYDMNKHEATSYIDTTGLMVFRSRRVVNRGHGEQDLGQYEKAEEIFCYEGAVPFFRREALEDIKMLKSKPDTKFPFEYLDEDFVWYADELDLGWRLLHRSWQSWYDPSVKAAHDRSTTKKTRKTLHDFIEMRKEIPAKKRMLDYRNQRLAFIKNDTLRSFLQDFPYWFPRDFALLAYFLLFEPTSLEAYPGIVRMLPMMLKKRKMIMARRTNSRAEMRKWFK